jgi:BirA family biotin operon repressor/biotin-[acetyl-CoA-carboxylase] ligase
MQLATRAVERLCSGRLIGSKIIYLPQVDSTQNLARFEAEHGAPEGTVVVAEEQTAGRGRFDRRWVSPPGVNLYFTVVLRPNVARLRALSMVAPLAIVRAILLVTDLKSELKWPNDVIIGERKVAGILSEAVMAGQEVDFALLGIGVNVNLDAGAYTEIADIATSLRTELGYEISRELLLLALLRELEDLYLQAPSEAIFNEWRWLLTTLGREVRASVGDRVEEGVAEDVDASGDLILRRADGSRITIAAGDVTLRN